MPASRTSKALVGNKKIVLTSTMFDNTGDDVVAKVNADSITLSNYTRRHVILKGSFTASFPGTDEVDEVISTGSMWPTRASYQLLSSTFVVTANSPGSTYYCVIPANVSDQLTINEIALTPGQSHVVNKGVVVFVFGTNYTVNGGANIANGVFACENSSAIVRATQSCTVLEFSVPN
jgi:hypothetical protein